MGRTVLITGAGGGLGGAVVAAFAAHDWRVVAPVRREGARIAGAETVVADLTDAGAVAAALGVAAGAADYVTSKAALHALAEVVAHEHRDDGIRCNTVVPGTIDTPANREAGMKGGG